MPIICIGPVCIPVAAVWPVLILLVQPVWAWLERRFPWLKDVRWVQKVKRLLAKPNPKKNNQGKGKDTGGDAGVVEPAVLSAEEVKGVVHVKDLPHWLALQRYSKDKGVPLVVDFTAPWCGPCQKIAPLFESLSSVSANKGVFAKVDVDECQDVSEACDVGALPCFQVFKGEELTDKLTGAREEALRGLFSAAFANSE